eukprot:m.259391 g.259391  ORF g.259391 m.259391 type:complete len:80 (+) comp19662_c0_seq12:1119-1358(+)
MTCYNALCFHPDWVGVRLQSIPNRHVIHATPCPAMCAPASFMLTFALCGVCSGDTYTSPGNGGFIDPCLEHVAAQGMFV